MSFKNSNSKRTYRKLKDLSRASADNEELYSITTESPISLTKVPESKVINENEYAYRNIKYINFDKPVIVKDCSFLGNNYCDEMFGFFAFGTIFNENSFKGRQNSEVYIKAPVNSKMAQKNIMYQKMNEGYCALLFKNGYPTDYFKEYDQYIRNKYRELIDRNK